MVNFGDLIFEQAPQEVAVRMRKFNLQALGRVGNLIKVSADALMDAETLPRNHVLAFHNTFRFEVQPDRRLTRIYRLYHTTHDFTHLFAEILKLLISFSVVDFLLDSLTGSLGCNAPKICGGRLHHHQVPNLGFWIILACFF